MIAGDMSRRRFLLIGSASVGAAVLGSGTLVGLSDASGAQPAPGTGTLERLRKQGYVRVGFANETPFSYATTQGTLTGESIVVAQACLKPLGLKNLEGVLTPFGSLIPGLLASRFDMIAAGMYVEPARCTQILFSDPDYRLGEAMLVAAGNPHHLHSYADIAKQPKLTLGVVAGGEEVAYAQASGVKSSQMVVFPDGPSALAGLEDRRVEAFTLSSLSINSLLKKAKNTSITLATPFIQPTVDGKSVAGCGAFGFRKNEADFRDAFNVQLDELRNKHGLLPLLSPFGFTQDDMPTAADTAANLCAGKAP